MSYAKGSGLGQKMAFPQQYDPEQLFTIERSETRAGLPEKLPFAYGYDQWHAWEFSCLDGRGKPLCGVLQMLFPQDTPRLVESKSMKLYLNSFSMTVFESLQAAVNTIQTDLSRAVGAPVRVVLMPEHPQSDLWPQCPEGDCLDQLSLDVDTFELDRSLLQGLCVSSGPAREQTYWTALFRSCCPVTGQPDWATIQVRIRSAPLEPKELLLYLLSWRTHQGFHEHCVESIFADIHDAAHPESLSVRAWFTRRGGIDISPVRSSQPVVDAMGRLLRQ